MPCEGCPHPEACAAARCVDDVIAEQFARFNTMQGVRVMSKPQAVQVIARLEAGDTARTLSTTNVVTPGKLMMHMATWPVWGAWAGQMITKNRKASHVRRMAWKKSPTHCKHGHEMTPENTAHKSNGTTQCKTCKLIAAGKGREITEAEREEIKRKLSAGIPLHWIAGTHKTDRSHYIANFASVNRARREHPDFGAFVAQAIVGSHSRGQVRRAQRVMIVRRRQEAADYEMIRAMVPRYLPIRDEIVSAIYLALLEGEITRDEVPKRIDHFRRLVNQEGPARHVRRTEMRLDAPQRTGGERLLIETLHKGLVML